MLRKLGLVTTAIALMAAQSAPAFAQEWRHIYAPQDNTLAGVMNERDVAGMAYLKIPFGGTAHMRKQPVQYGFAVATRLPDQTDTTLVDTRRGLAPLMNLSFSPDGFDDLKVNGLSMRESYQRLAYRSEGEPSAWWTYGLMALALGTAAVVVVAASSDGSKQ
ncbi:MAG: hypothetical protein GC201_14140 [Alphaproteobacteria bacterium]|nr:hypothetical protein [Alphaproteobacteria bacterium]